MSADDPLAGPPDGHDSETLAAEHALGMLEGAERLAAQTRVAADPQFARAVEGWQARFAALVGAVTPVPAPPAVWSAIERRLGEAEPANVVMLRLKRSLVVWRGASAAAAALAAVLAVALVWPHAQPAPVTTAAPALMSARLSGTPHGPTVFVAVYDPGRRAIVLTPASVDASPDRSPELWLIPTGGKPIALGVAAFDGSVQLVPAAGEGVSHGVLAVSVEPKGGSPTGQPTGPVIATGQLARL